MLIITVTHKYTNEIFVRSKHDGIGDLGNMITDVLILYINTVKVVIRGSSGTSGVFDT